MYYGKSSPELETVRKEYEKMFNFDPNGEMELEFGDDHDDYLSVLKQCVDEKKDMFEVLTERGEY